MQISRTLINNWWTVAESRTNPSIRVGQDFYNYFKCHKVTNPDDVAILDRLYNLDGVEAVQTINAITDWDN